MPFLNFCCCKIAELWLQTKSVNIHLWSGSQLEGLKPKYALPHKENMSGRGDEMIYHSKGHALNPNKRDWKRYEAWQPQAEIK